MALQQNVGMIQINVLPSHMLSSCYRNVSVKPSVNMHEAISMSADSYHRNYLPLFRVRWEIHAPFSKCQYGGFTLNSAEAFRILLT